MVRCIGNDVNYTKLNIFLICVPKFKTTNKMKLLENQKLKTISKTTNNQPLNRPGTQMTDLLVNRFGSKNRV